MTASQLAAGGWTDHAAVMEWLGLGYGKLRELMDATPPHVAKPWRDINVSSHARKPRYRWRVARGAEPMAYVDRWFQEVTQWHGQSDGRAGGASVNGSHGASPSGTGPSPSGPKRLRSVTGGRSKKSPPKADGGILARFDLTTS